MAAEDRHGDTEDLAEAHEQRRPRNGVPHLEVAEPSRVQPSPADCRAQVFGRHQQLGGGGVAGTLNDGPQLGAAQTAQCVGVVGELGEQDYVRQLVGDREALARPVLPDLNGDHKPAVSVHLKSAVAGEVTDLAPGAGGSQQ